ncbi:MAG: ATP-binding protein [Planctomycetota bacterium]|jgi:signal transduction histidine kinase
MTAQESTASQAPGLVPEPIIRGFSHAVQNSLSAIELTLGQVIDSLEEASREGASPDTWDDALLRLGLLRDEANLARRTVTNFVQLSRPFALSVEALDLRELVEAQLAKARTDLKATLIAKSDTRALRKLETVRCEVDEAPPLPAVLGDRGRLEAALHAVATNSLEALLTGGEGPSDLLSVRFDTHPNTKRVLVEFDDNGRGIRDYELDRVFYPFFSMKPDHEGVGLSWARRIVEALGGVIDVVPNGEVGTIVSIALPSA